MLCGYAVELLQIGWKDREIVKNLLYSALEGKICSRGGLLEQFLHSKLDKIAENMKRGFDLDQDLKVDYNHSTYAKFCTLFEAIQEKQKLQQEVKEFNLLNILSLDIVKEEQRKKLEIIFRFDVFSKPSKEFDEEFLKNTLCEHVWDQYKKVLTMDTIIYKCPKCSSFKFNICYPIDTCIV